MPHLAFLRRRSVLSMSAVALVMASAAAALATSYDGYGDTGWTFDNKRDCCEEAVWLAQEDSIRRCEEAGGVPRVRSGSTRGLCDWDARGDSWNRVYRCTATASVYCR